MREEHNALLPAWQAGRGVFARLQNYANRLPGADLAREAMLSIEDIALRELKARLERVERPPREQLAAEAPSVAQNVDPRLLLAALLEESTQQSREDARRGAYSSVLLRLTADEAALLAALSDGSSYPLIHVHLAARFGSGECIAENISTLARRSAVKMREHVPRHIGHLTALGLVEIGPEDKNEEIAYQTLEGDPYVQTLRRLHAEHNRSLRCVRRTLRLSPFGRELWEYCAASDG